MVRRPNVGNWFKSEKKQKQLVNNMEFFNRLLSFYLLSPFIFVFKVLFKSRKETKSIGLLSTEPWSQLGQDKVIYCSTSLVFLTHLAWSSIFQVGEHFRTVFFSIRGASQDETTILPSIVLITEMINSFSYIRKAILVLSFYVDAEF